MKSWKQRFDKWLDWALDENPGFMIGIAAFCLIVIIVATVLLQASPSSGQGQPNPVGYVEIHNDGVPVDERRQILNFIGGTCVDNATGFTTDCPVGEGGSGGPASPDPRDDHTGFATAVAEEETDPALPAHTATANAHHEPGAVNSHAMCDWDNDGTTYVTCDGLESPLPWCKVAGELVWGDFADDLNAGIYGTGTNTSCPVVGNSDTIQLVEAVYPIAPCWDSSNHATHDYSKPYDITQSDGIEPDEPEATIAGLCATDRAGKALTTLALQNWQGTLNGAGSDERRNDVTSMTARGAGRTKGTTISIDMGDASGTWFGNNADIAPFSIGFDAPQACSPLGLGCNTGTHVDDPGFGKGFGSVYEPVDHSSVDPVNGFAICACNSTSCGASSTGWVSTLVPGDKVMVGSAVNDNVHSYDPKSSVLSYRETLSVCGVSDLGALMRFGWAPNNTGDENNRNTLVKPGGSWSNDNGFSVFHIPSDKSDGKTIISNLTIEPADWWLEPGGACAPTLNDPADKYYQADLYPLLEDTAPDCDTVTLFKWFYGNHVTLDRITWKNWGHFLLDGGGAATSIPMLVDNTFLYTSGPPIDDSQARTHYIRPRFMHNAFKGDVFAALGERIVDDMYISDSSFSTILSFKSESAGSRFTNTRIQSSAFSTGFYFSDGATDGIIDGLFSTGRISNYNGSTISLIKLECNGCVKDIKNNVFSRLHDDPPMGAWANDTDISGNETYVEVYFTSASDVPKIHSNIFTDTTMEAVTANSSRTRMFCTRNGQADAQARHAFYANNTFDNLEISGAGAEVLGTTGGSSWCNGTLDAAITPMGCNVFNDSGGTRQVEGTTCTRGDVVGSAGIDQTGPDRNVSSCYVDATGKLVGQCRVLYFGDSNSCNGISQKLLRAAEQTHELSFGCYGKSATHAKGWRSDYPPAAYGTGTLPTGGRLWDEIIQPELDRGDVIAAVIELGTNDAGLMGNGAGYTLASYTVAASTPFQCSAPGGDDPSGLCATNYAKEQAVIDLKQIIRDLWAGGVSRIILKTASPTDDRGARPEYQAQADQVWADLCPWTPALASWQAPTDAERVGGIFCVDSNRLVDGNTTDINTGVHYNEVGLDKMVLAIQSALEGVQIGDTFSYNTRPVLHPSANLIINGAGGGTIDTSHGIHVTDNGAWIAFDESTGSTTGGLRVPVSSTVDPWFFFRKEFGGSNIGPGPHDNKGWMLLDEIGADYISGNVHLVSAVTQPTLAYNADSADPAIPDVYNIVATKSDHDPTDGQAAIFDSASGEIRWTDVAATATDISYTDTNTIGATDVQAALDILSTPPIPGEVGIRAIIAATGNAAAANGTVPFAEFVVGVHTDTQPVLCTGAATPDAACGALGEIVIKSAGIYSIVGAMGFVPDDNSECRNWIVEADTGSGFAGATNVGYGGDEGTGGQSSVASFQPLMDGFGQFPVDSVLRVTSTPCDITGVGEWVNFASFIQIVRDEAGSGVGSGGGGGLHRSISINYDGRNLNTPIANGAWETLSATAGSSTPVVRSNTTDFTWNPGNTSITYSGADPIEMHASVMCSVATGNGFQESLHLDSLGLSLNGSNPTVLQIQQSPASRDWSDWSLLASAWVGTLTNGDELSVEQRASQNVAIGVGWGMNQNACVFSFMEIGDEGAAVAASSDETGGLSRVFGGGSDIAIIEIIVIVVLTVLILFKLIDLADIGRRREAISAARAMLRFARIIK